MKASSLSGTINPPYQECPVEIEIKRYSSSLYQECEVRFLAEDLIINA